MNLATSDTLLTA